jgi:hypothetical protein
MKKTHGQSERQPADTTHRLRRSRAIVWSGMAVTVAIMSGGVHAGEFAARTDLGPSELSLSGQHGLSARILQLGDLNDAALRQSGSQHASYMDQIGTGNDINAIQVGQANQFLANQAGNGNEIELTQAGRANIATVTQLGSSHRASIEQSGNANVVNVQQLPFSPNLLVQQRGNGLVAKVIQY